MYKIARKNWTGVHKSRSKKHCIYLLPIKYVYFSSLVESLKPSFLYPLSPGMNAQGAKELHVPSIGEVSLAKVAVYNRLPTALGHEDFFCLWPFWFLCCAWVFEIFWQGWNLKVDHSTMTFWVLPFPQKESFQRVGKLAS